MKIAYDNACTPEMSNAIQCNHELRSSFWWLIENTEEAKSDNILV